MDLSLIALLMLMARLMARLLAFFVAIGNIEQTFNRLWIKIPNASSGEHLKDDHRMVQGMLAPLQFHEYLIMIK